MSTRSQKRRNNQQENSENVSEIVSSLILVENVESSHQDALVAERSLAKSLRIESRVLEEIASEIKGLLVESQREFLKLLKSISNESTREQEDNSLESEPKDHQPK